MGELNTAHALKRDGWVRVQTSSDYMEAYLIIEPPTGDGKWPTVEEALEVLRSENICSGLKEEAVVEAIAKRSSEPYLVAKGEKPTSGEDAIQKIYFVTEGVKQEYQEDQSGKINYRDFQSVHDVIVGEVLAEKIPATQGIPGFNVYGEKTVAVPGKDKPFKIGKNVIFDNEGLRVISKINGEPTLVNDQISVFPIHEVKGDVNFKTGNISFNGSVIVWGNVDNGFKLEADGDITIRGSVEAADIKTGGHLTILGGVSGMDKTSIVCNGNFSAKYIEHASIDCEGNINVKEGIMYCQVNADQKIIADLGKGLIVGGTLRAGEEITAKTIGSKFGTLTELEVGVKPKTKIEYQQLEVKIRENKASLEKVEQARSMLEKIANLPKDRQDMLQNLVKTSFVLKGQISEAEARRKQILEEIVVLSKEKARIKVKETIFPGVRVTIGKATTVVKDEFKFAILLYHDGEVQMQSYR